MANLEKIAESLNINLFKNNLNTHKPTGIKRRAWLPENILPEDKGVYKPLLEKGSINPLEKGSIDPFQKGSINPIDQPLYDKGSIDPFKSLNITLEKLRGNPLKIAQYLFERLKDNSNRITDKVTQTDLIKNLGISKDSTKTGMKFLLKTNALKRVDFKIGKGGWSKYKLKDKLFEEFTTAYEKGSIDPFQKGSIISSSSYITTTTNNEGQILNKKVNINFESLVHIGFSETQIRQLNEKNTPDVIQESLNHFAYALKNNPKVKAYSRSFKCAHGSLKKRARLV